MGPQVAFSISESFGKPPLKTPPWCWDTTIDKSNCITLGPLAYCNLGTSRRSPQPSPQAHGHESHTTEQVQGAQGSLKSGGNENFREWHSFCQIYFSIPLLSIWIFRDLFLSKCYKTSFLATKWRFFSKFSGNIQCSYFGLLLSHFLSN